MALIHSTRVTLDMIKWEHSIFALPFALAGAMLAAGGVPTVWQLTWIVVAMVAARSAAMAFNRVIDLEYDAANPRTRMRALPAGLLTQRFVIAFVIVSSLVFIFAAAQLNRLCLYLSPVALAILLLYSYTKRFTRWSHLVLGFADAIPPAAAWIAVRGTLDWQILPLVGAVTFWVGGFDVLYACQDYDFDRQIGLHSIPRHLGIRKALIVAQLSHVVTVGFLAWTSYLFGLGVLGWIAVLVFAALLAYEHSLVKHDDLSKLDAAFFTTNGFVSVLYFLFIAAAVLVKR
ncbi:MAG TPA: UbiA-like polyprenyltransferase [Terriglobales bacterium]|nr:UbiA-like polyprenyltransferase [Terriglobales bacterium]